MKLIRICAVALFAGVLLANAVIQSEAHRAQDRSVRSSFVTPSPEPPLTEARLTVHTLLREDVFAGLLVNDLKRLAKAEKNIDTLMVKRPAEEANLLAWKGSATLVRAVNAHEAGKSEEFERLYKQVGDLFTRASKPKTGNNGVFAITGGSYGLFADRLPEANRASAWAIAYDNYKQLWKQQSAILQALPVHHRGEVLGGLAMSAARTGHKDEAKEIAGKMLTMLKDTSYEPLAKKWTENIDAPTNPSMVCMSCHEGARLAPSVAALAKP